MDEALIRIRLEDETVETPHAFDTPIQPQAAAPIQQPQPAQPPQPLTLPTASTQPAQSVSNLTPQEIAFLKSVGVDDTHGLLSGATAKALHSDVPQVIQPVAIIPTVSQPAMSTAQPQTAKQPAQAVNSPKPFDVVAEVKEMREANIKREQIKAAYDSMYGSAQQTKSAFDSTLDIAQKMRGTIGGIFGKLAGVSLDVVAGIKAAQPAQKSELRQEAERRNALPQPASNITPPQPAQAVPPTPASNITPLAETGTITAPKVISSAAPVETAVASAGVEEAAAARIGALGAASVATAGALAPVAVAAIAVAASVVAFKATVDEINKTATKYAAYSPQLAQAQAVAEVRSSLGDMRRANDSGPVLAKFIEAQSQAQQTWEDIKIGILNKLTPIATTIMEIINGLMPFLEVALAPLKLTADAISEIIGFFKKVLEFLHIIAKNTKTDDADFSFDPSAMVFPDVTGI